jgi:hypothetical protein
MTKPPQEKAKLSGAQLVGMVTVLEAFMVALIAKEAPTRSDPVQFVRDLRLAAIASAKEFGHAETIVQAELYAEQVIEAAVVMAGISMDGASNKQEPKS